MNLGKFKRIKRNILKFSTFCYFKLKKKFGILYYQLCSLSTVRLRTSLDRTDTEQEHNKIRTKTRTRTRTKTRTGTS
jgi:hypothetical protein